jgi:hypothetical protein
MDRPRSLYQACIRLDDGLIEILAVNPSKPVYLAKLALWILVVVLPANCEGG